MILVTVGSSKSPFDRLLRAVDELEVEDRLVVQHGSSSIRPKRAECVDFLDFDELAAYIRSARIVITHAGVGSIMTCLANGTRPIVMPRRESFGEAVDDHQLPFARRAREIGLVEIIEDAAALVAALRPQAMHRREVASGGSAIERDLRTYIENTIGAVTLPPYSGRSKA